MASMFSGSGSILLKIDGLSSKCKEFIFFYFSTTVDVDFMLMSVLQLFISRLVKFLSEVRLSLDLGWLIVSMVGKLS